MTQDKRTLPAAKTLALVAHDHRKQALVDWCRRHQDLLAAHRLCATGTTGRLIASALGREVELHHSGPLGGDQQIGARIAEGSVHALVFFWDPLEAQPHDPDIKALLRLAAVWNIPVACNEATADMLVASPLFARDYDCALPGIAAYASRSLP